MVAERTFDDVYRFEFQQGKDRYDARDDTRQQDERQADGHACRIDVPEDVDLPAEQLGEVVLCQKSQTESGEEGDEDHKRRFHNQFHSDSAAVAAEQPSRGHLLGPEARVGHGQIDVVGHSEQEYRQHHGQKDSEKALVAFLDGQAVVSGVKHQVVKRNQLCGRAAEKAERRNLVLEDFGDVIDLAVKARPFVQHQERCRAAKRPGSEKVGRIPITQNLRRADAVGNHLQCSEGRSCPDP